MEAKRETPLSPSLTSPKFNPWLIVIIGLVVLCCMCIGTVGLLLAFGEPILNELGLIQVHLSILII